jgi:hypothetical protein
MINQDLVDLIRPLLLPLQQNVWYAINPTDDFNPTLNYAANLSEYNYITIFLAAGIFYYREEELCVRQTHLEQLQQFLQENMTNYISRCQKQRRKHLYFISINQPTFNKPTRQLEENLRIIIPPRNQLNDRQWQLLNHLLDERNGGDEDMPDEYPPAENDDAANILLELREGYNSNNEEEPMLVDEEEEQEVEQAQQHQPYQLTLRYRERLRLAQQRFEPSLADCRMHYWERFENEERAFFEQQRHLEEEVEKIVNEGVVDEVVVDEDDVEEEVVVGEEVVVDEDDDEEEVVVDEDDDEEEVVVDEDDIKEEVVVGEEVVVDEDDDEEEVPNGDDGGEEANDDDDDDDDGVNNNIIIDNGDDGDNIIIDDNKDDEVNLIEVVEEGMEEEEEEEGFIANERRHIINYVINLPVETTMLAGNHQQHNQGGLVELHNKKQF